MDEYIEQLKRAAAESKLPTKPVRSEQPAADVAQVATPPTQPSIAATPAAQQGNVASEAPADAYIERLKRAAKLSKLSEREQALYDRRVGEAKDRKSRDLAIAQAMEELDVRKQQREMVEQADPKLVKKVEALFLNSTNRSGGGTPGVSQDVATKARQAIGQVREGFDPKGGRDILTRLREMTPKEREEVLKLAPGVAQKLGEDRGNPLWRAYQAFDQGLANDSNAYWEFIGQQGTEEELQFMRQIEALKAAEAGAYREDDPWYAKWPLQALEMSPFTISMAGGSSAGKVAVRGGVEALKRAAPASAAAAKTLNTGRAIAKAPTALRVPGTKIGAAAMTAEGAGAIAGTTAASYVPMYMQERQSLIDAGMQEGLQLNLLAGGTGFVGALVESIIPNPLPEGMTPLNQGAMAAARKYLWETVKKLPGEVTEEAIQGVVSGLGQVIAHWLDENVEEKTVVQSFQQGFEQGKESIGPLLFLMGAPSAVGLAGSASRAAKNTSEFRGQGANLSPREAKQADSLLKRLTKIRDKKFLSEKDAKSLGIPGGTRPERMFYLKEEIGRLSQIMSAYKGQSDATSQPSSQQAEQGVAEAKPGQAEAQPVERDAPQAEEQDVAQDRPGQAKGQEATDLGDGDALPQESAPQVDVEPDAAQDKKPSKATAAFQGLLSKRIKEIDDTLGTEGVNAQQSQELAEERELLTGQLAKIAESPKTQTEGDQREVRKTDAEGNQTSPETREVTEEKGLQNKEAVVPATPVAKDGKSTSPGESPATNVDDFQGFGADTPQGGELRTSLSQTIEHQGKQQPVKQVVEEAVQAGATIKTPGDQVPLSKERRQALEKELAKEDLQPGGRSKRWFGIKKILDVGTEKATNTALVLPDGTTLDAAQLGEAGVQYAGHLIANPPAQTLRLVIKDRDQFGKVPEATKALRQQFADIADIGETFTHSSYEGSEFKILPGGEILETTTRRMMGTAEGMANKLKPGQKIEWTSEKAKAKQASRNAAPPTQAIPATPQPSAQGSSATDQKTATGPQSAQQPSPSSKSPEAQASPQATPPTKAADAEAQQQDKQPAKAQDANTSKSSQPEPAPKKEPSPNTTEPSGPKADGATAGKQEPGRDKSRDKKAARKRARRKAAGKFFEDVSDGALLAVADAAGIDTEGMTDTLTAEARKAIVKQLANNRTVMGHVKRSTQAPSKQQTADQAEPGPKAQEPTKPDAKSEAKPDATEKVPPALQGPNQDAKIVPWNELSLDEKSQSRILREMGVSIRFITNSSKDMPGFFSHKTNTIWINRDYVEAWDQALAGPGKPQKAMTWGLFAHEMFHAIRRSNPAVWTQLYDWVAELEAARAKTGLENGLTKAGDDYRNDMKRVLGQLLQSDIDAFNTRNSHSGRPPHQRNKAHNLLRQVKKADDAGVPLSEITTSTAKLYAALQNQDVMADEALARYLEYRAGEFAFWDSLGKENPGILSRVGRWLRRVLRFAVPNSLAGRVRAAIEEAMEAHNLPLGDGSRAAVSQNAFAIDKINVNDVREKDRKGSRVSKGLAVKNVGGVTVFEETDGLSFEYVAKHAPKVFIKNANTLADYPIVRGKKKFEKARTVEQAQEIYNVFVREVADNLTYLYTAYNPELSALSTLWYDGANDIAHTLAKDYSVSPEQAAGIIAAMSPQKDWYQNVRLAELLLQAFKVNPITTREMVDYQKDVVRVDGLKEYNRKARSAERSLAKLKLEHKGTTIDNYRKAKLVLANESSAQGDLKAPEAQKLAAKAGIRVETTTGQSKPSPNEKAALHKLMNWARSVDRALSDIELKKVIAKRRKEINARIKEAKAASVVANASLAEAIVKADDVIKILEGNIGKPLDSVPEKVQAFMVRLYHEVNTTKDYNVIAPDGSVVGVAKNDGGENSRLAWGSYGEIGKGVSIRNNGSQKNITRRLGQQHKIRNFYNNIIDPMSEDGDVTMDTHAIAAALLMALSGKSTQVTQNFGGGGTGNSGAVGVKGLYYAFAEAYNLAAKEIGLLPRQVQSATWDPVRGLFTDVFKSSKQNVANINDIWERYANGEISVKEAREKVFEAAGGIDTPTWARPVRDAAGGSVQKEGVGRGVRGDGQASIRPATRGRRGRGRGDGGRADGDRAAVRQRPESTGDRGGRDQSRKIAALAGSPSVPGINGPDPEIVAVAERYAAENGIELKRQAEYVQVDEKRAKRIANAYETMEHAPQDPMVKEAYQDLIKQTTAQYKALVDAGYKFWFTDLNVPSNVEYLSSPYNSLRDLRNNKQMGVFPTSDGFGTSDLDVNDNPLLADTGFMWPSGGLDGELKPVLANDLFRAVHDAFGHSLEGAGFRARGEENAWQAHVRLFTGPAVGAITSETRGQNSWLNYGPHGEKNRTAKVEDTTFADQKTGLMPEWTWTEGRAADLDITIKENYDGTTEEDGSQSKGGRAAVSRNGKDATTAVRGRVGPNGRIWRGSRNRRTLGGYDLVADYQADAPEWVESGVSAPPLIELQKSAKSATQFTTAINAARESQGSLGASVYVYPEQDYRDMRLFLTEDGKAGFALKDTGAAGVTEIVSVFNTADGSHRGISYSMMRLAVEEGGNVLDAFDTFLPGVYSANGFRVISRVTWNDDYAPEGWSKDEYAAFNNGKPDVVLMAYDPGRTDIYRHGSGEGQAFDDIDEAVKLQRSAATEYGTGDPNLDFPDLDAGARAAVARQTDTPAFKKWFGDSKVVDADGKPLVVYHGTDNEFSVFTPGRVSQRSVMLSSFDVTTSGFFFSPSEEDARSYGENIIPAYLSVKRPLTDPNEFAVSSRSTDDVKEAAKKAWSDAEYILEPMIYEDGGKRWIDTGGGVSNTEVKEDGAWVSQIFADGMIDWHVLDNPQVVERMKELGYDGVKVYEENDSSGESWFVVDPAQIKSATENQGTFDPSNPDIRFATSRQNPDDKVAELLKLLANQKGGKKSKLSADGRTTGVKNVKTDQQRVVAGFDERVQTDPASIDEWEAEALRRHYKDPMYRVRLAEDLVETQRESDAVEQRALGQYLRDLENRRLRGEDVRDEMLVAIEASEVSGKALGQAFRARQETLAPDFSVVGIVRQHAQTVGSMPSDAQMDKYEELADKLKTLEGKLGELESQLAQAEVDKSIAESAKQPVAQPIKRGTKRARIMKKVAAGFAAFKDAWGGGTSDRAAVGRQTDPPEFTEWFSEKALESAHREAEGKSRSKLIRMSIDDFLRMAETLDGPAPSKVETVNKVLSEGNKFSDVPYLGFTHDRKGNAKVTSHEGRHRAMALKARGVVTIPVRLHSDGADAIRWNQQQKGQFDRIEGEWPKVLQGQTSGKIAFPVADPAASLDQTDTPAFKKWFGDSKVVDSDGKPLVVYHGTNSEKARDGGRGFNAFDPSTMGRRDVGYFGKGFYFSPNPVAGEMYAGYEPGARILPVYLNIQNPYIYERDDRAGPPAVKSLQEQGYDGIFVMKTWDGKSRMAEIVAFDPTQIKSATGNQGTFDPSNPDIRFATSRERQDAKQAAESVVRALRESGVVSMMELEAQVKANMPDATPEQIQVFKDAWTATSPKASQSLAGILDSSGIGRLARDLMRVAVYIGIEGRDAVIDAVHNELLSQGFKLSRSETMAAMSGYGDFRELSKDDISVTIRGINGEIQQLLKLEDMQAGRAPRKTGVERREPTDDEKRLIKQVNDAKKRGGYTVTDPERQLRTALASAKTAVANRLRELQEEIDELQDSIDNKKPRKPAEKSQLTPDTELESLRDRAAKKRLERDELKKKYHKYFPVKKAGVSDAARLKAAEKLLDRMIVEAQADIDARNFDPKPRGPKLTSPELEEKRAQLKRLRERLTSAKKAAAEAETAQWESEGGATKGTKPLSKAEKRLRTIKRQIRSLQEELAAGELGPKGKAIPVSSPEIEAAKRQLEDLRAVREQARKASPEYQAKMEARQTARYKKALEKELAFWVARRDNAANGILPDKRKPTTPKAKEILEAKWQIELVKRDARAEIELAERAARSRTMKAIGFGGDLLDFARAIQTGYEMSATLRQGAMYTVGHPRRALSAIIKSFEAVFSRRADFSHHEDLLKRPNHLDYMAGGLETTAADGPLSHREEVLRSRIASWLSKTEGWMWAIPRWGAEGVLASERSFRTFSNIMRADLFDYMKSSVEASRPGTFSEDDAKVIANASNIFSGRAPMRHSVAWGRILYAPRWVWSRALLSVGQPLWKGDKATRLAVGKVYVRAAIGMAALQAMRSLLYYLLADDEDDTPQYEFDMRSSDFAKMRIGDVRLDTGAGINQLAVLAARLATGQTKRKSGDIVNLRGDDVPYGADDTVDVMTRFLRTKLAPLPSGVIDYIAGENVVGQKATAAKIVGDRLTPMTWSDIWDAEAELNIPQGTVAAIEAFFGVGISTYGDKSEYRNATPEERKEKIEKDLKRIDWNSPTPAYREFLEPGQVDQFESRKQAKLQSLVNVALSSPERRNYKTAETYQRAVRRRDEAAEELKSAGFKASDIRKLLFEYWRANHGPTRDESYQIDPRLQLRLRQIPPRFGGVR